LTKRTIVSIIHYTMDKSFTGPYLFFISLSFVWCAGIFAAPLLQNAGMHAAAGVLYEAFGRVCHQRAGRSFFCAGQQLGVCIRCTSVYLSFFASAVLFPFLVRRKWRRMERPPASILEMIPSQTIALICFLPMLFDVGLSIAGISVSTTITRVVSGTMLGLILPWYVIPVFLDAWVHIRFETIKKKEKTQ